MAELACPICESSRLTEKYARGAWRYAACRSCGHATLTPLPDSLEMAAFYEQSYFVASQTGGYDDYLQDEPLHRLNARDRLKWLVRSGATPGSLVDIGCAAGFFLDEARQAGWNVSGVDCSEWARGQVRERFNLPTFASLSEARAASEQSFRAITLFQVLEHLPDPASTLREVASCLDEQGVLVIETWNRESLVARLCGGNWQQITPPSVLHLFSNRSLRQLVEASGFRNVQICRSGKRVSAGFVGNLLHKKYPRLMTPLGWFASRRLVRDISVRYALGDLITLVARKAPLA